MQDSEVTAFACGLNFFNAIEADDRRTANAHEAGRPQHRFEARHCFAKQVVLCVRVENCVIATGLDPVNLLGLDKCVAIPAANAEPRIGLGWKWWRRP